MKPKQLGRVVTTPALPNHVIAEIFARQLGSGLWEGDDGTAQGTLVATTRALSDCADSLIDSAHPEYGARVEKAIRAVCAIAREPGAGPGKPDEADISLALVAALKTAADAELRAEAMTA